MINVIWFDRMRGSWDHGLLMSIFDKHPDIFVQHNSKELIYPDKSIVIVVGKPLVASLRAYLDKLKTALVILTSDEDSYFDWKAAIPERHEIWTQYYAPNKSEIKTRLLLGAPSRIKDYITEPIMQYAPTEKKYLWSFIGQVQNPHRQKCVEVLKTLPDGYLKIVEGFSGTLGGEVEYQEYLDIMRQSKFVICPSGSMCADTFRVYEAMECGAIPITEKRCPRDAGNYNYWKELEVYKFINAFDSDWAVTKEPVANQYRLTGNNEWWNLYKQSLEQKLLSCAK